MDGRDLLGCSAKAAAPGVFAHRDCHRHRIGQTSKLRRSSSVGKLPRASARRSGILACAADRSRGPSQAIHGIAAILIREIHNSYAPVSTTSSSRSGTSWFSQNGCPPMGESVQRWTAPLPFTNSRMLHLSIPVSREPLAAPAPAWFEPDSFGQAIVVDGGPDRIG